MEQARLYRSGDPAVEGFEDTRDHRGASRRLRQSARTDIDPHNSVPLFLSDHDGEPDPSEYFTPARKRRASISSKVLAGVCAAAAVAVLVALFSSDATRSIVASVKASMAAVVPAPPAAAQSDATHLTARDRQKEPARLSAADDQPPVVRSVATVAVSPAREEIKIAYQNALQGRTLAAAPATAAPVTAAPVTVAAVAEPTTTGSAVTGSAVHHLDPDAVIASLKRADALMASGDVAAARLVLRRAAEAGDARAAMTLAETYDPAFLEKLGVHGFVPDLAKARSWYEKAKAFGSAEAPRRLERLASKRQ